MYIHVYMCDTLFNVSLDKAAGHCSRFSRYNLKPGFAMRLRPLLVFERAVSKAERKGETAEKLKGDSRGEARLYAYTEAVALDLSLRNLPCQRKIIYMYKCISIFVPPLSLTI